ncbi:hypothetical protein [Planomonospora sp. ID91781]|uniref:hypothetical protein n=1 Tax=Planomonospora sp. ID91781 TaxID=2738135 RepID=UPI0018C44DE9|nr:hypothetical protein [Planomonospora sp. ID91781]
MNRGSIVLTGLVGLAAALALVAVQAVPTGPPGGGDGAPATPTVAARYAETTAVLERAAGPDPRRRGSRR